jgi:hypothetical protein
MPTGGTRGEALFDAAAHGQIHHPLRVMTARRGHRGQREVARLPAVGTVGTRGGHAEVNGTTGVSIAEGVEPPLVGLVARGKDATSRARGLLVATAIKAQWWGWKVLDIDHTLGGVWHVCTRSKPRWLPWKNGWSR